MAGRQCKHTVVRNTKLNQSLPCENLTDHLQVCIFLYDLDASYHFSSVLLRVYCLFAFLKRVFTMKESENVHVC